MPGEHEALRNDRAYVVGAVRRIERPVAGNDLGLDVGLQLFGRFHGAKVVYIYLDYRICPEIPEKRMADKDCRPSLFRIRMLSLYVCAAI